jgi:hypothetical protein
VRFRKLAAAALIAGTGAAVLTGCDTGNGSFQGSGVIVSSQARTAVSSVTGPIAITSKLNAGYANFTVLCHPNGGVSGSLSYVDPFHRVQLQGTPTELPFLDYCDNNTTHGEYLGTFTSSQDHTSGDFTFEIDADPSCQSGFRAALYLSDGAGQYGTYSNSGCFYGQLTPLYVTS